MWRNSFNVCPIGKWNFFINKYVWNIEENYYVSLCADWQRSNWDFDFSNKKLNRNVQLLFCHEEQMVEQKKCQKGGEIYIMDFGYDCFNRPPISDVDCSSIWYFIWSTFLLHDEFNRNVCQFPVPNETIRHSIAQVLLRTMYAIGWQIFFMKCSWRHTPLINQTWNVRASKRTLACPWCTAPPHLL